MSERSELDYPSLGLRQHDSMWLTWVKMVLGPFAETKGPRLPGRDPASIGTLHHVRMLSAGSHPQLVMPDTLRFFMSFGE